MKQTMLTMSFSPTKSKPYTAITVQIDRLTNEHYDADDMSGIPDLIEVIRIQTGGPTEAARAVRKKLWAVTSLIVASSDRFPKGSMEMLINNSEPWPS